MEKTTMVLMPVELVPMSKPCFFRNNKLIDFNEFSAELMSTRKHIALHAFQNIMLFHTDSYKFTVLFFALILESKHILLPPNKQAGTLQKLAEHCDATAGDIKVKDKQQIVIPATSELIENTESLEQSHKALTTQLFTEFLAKSSGKVTFFTSGSTGQPKAIIKQCQQLVCELETLSASFIEQLNMADVVASTVSHQHIYGLLFKILLPLHSGKIIANKTFEYPEHIYEDLNDVIFKPLVNAHKNIMLVSSPAHLKRLVLDNVLGEHAEHYCATFSSGGLLSSEASQLYAEQMGKAPIEVFGSTETGGIAWRCGQINQDTPWQVFQNISYSTEKKSNRLVIHSPYVDEPAYLTDDCIEPINATHFILKGRVDRTVKLEEKRVNLDHIEQCLIAHPWVNDAKVFMIDSHKSLAQRKTLSCAVVIQENATILIEKQGKRALNEILKQHLLNEFERICLPKKWRYLEKFPYNSQGKLVLKDLERLFD
jgi:acyl-coenzyme A synthetase/AMP-(fatty) acid ligase